jgi:hypothetical protein
MRCSVAGLTTEHRIPGRLESFTKPANSEQFAESQISLFLNILVQATYIEIPLLWTNSPSSLHRNLHICKVREIASYLLYKLNFSGYEPAAINRITILQHSLELQPSKFAGRLLPSCNKVLSSPVFRPAGVGKIYKYFATA